MDTCRWHEDVDGSWEASCNHKTFIFNWDGPVDNFFKFCPYCGKPLDEVKYDD